MTTYHAALASLMLLGGFGIFLCFVRMERNWRDRQPLAGDMNAYLRQVTFGHGYSGVGAVLAVLWASLLGLLW